MLQAEPEDFADLNCCGVPRACSACVSTFFMPGFARERNQMQRFWKKERAICVRKGQAKAKSLTEKTQSKKEKDKERLSSMTAKPILVKGKP